MRRTRENHINTYHKIAALVAVAMFSGVVSGCSDNEPKGPRAYYMGLPPAPLTPTQVQSEAPRTTESRSEQSTLSPSEVHHIVTPAPYKRRTELATKAALEELSYKLSRLRGYFAPGSPQFLDAQVMIPYLEPSYLQVSETDLTAKGQTSLTLYQDYGHPVFFLNDTLVLYFPSEDEAVGGKNEILDFPGGVYILEADPSDFAVPPSSASKR